MLAAAQAISVFFPSTVELVNGVGHVRYRRNCGHLLSHFGCVCTNGRP